MKRKQQGQISKSIAGTVDGVSGGKEKDKGSAGAHYWW